MSDVPVVQVQGLHAHDDRGAIVGLDLALPAGVVGCLVGGRSDGSSVLAAVLSGGVRPGLGFATVGGMSPWNSPSTRARIGVLLDDPRLPDVGTVRQLFVLARSLRGDSPDRGEWFEAIGAPSLTRRKIAGLDRREARTVALALALSAPVPLLLVLHEPLAELVQADAAVLARTLRQRAREGACVLVLTASASDALALADDVATLKSGRIDRPIGAPDTDALVPGLALEMRVWTDKPRELAAALAADPSITALSFVTSDAVPLTLRSTDVEASSRSVARACLALGAEVRSMQVVPPGGRAMQEPAAPAGHPRGAP